MVLAEGKKCAFYRNVLCPMNLITGCVSQGNSPCSVERASYAVFHASVYRLQKWSGLPCCQPNNPLYHIGQLAVSVDFLDRCPGKKKGKCTANITTALKLYCNIVILLYRFAILLLKNSCTVVVKRKLKTHMFTA